MEGKRENNTSGLSVDSLVSVSCLTALQNMSNSFFP